MKRKGSAISRDIVRSTQVSSTTALSNMRTGSGLSVMRHPLSRWKLEQNMNAGVVTVRMVENAVLCDRGRSHNVLLEVDTNPTSFWVTGFHQEKTGSIGIT